MSLLSRFKSPSIVPIGKCVLRWMRRAFPDACALALLICGAASFVLGAGAASAQHVTGWQSGEPLRKWQPVRLTFEGPERSESASTFRDVRFNLRVTTPSGRQLTVPGFFAADGTAAHTSATSGRRWRVYVLPREQGTYRYEASVRCGDDVATSLGEEAGRRCAFDGESGSFSVEAVQSDAPGFYARGLLSQDGRLMRFDDGELFFKGGPDSPEDLLAYSDFDNTRSGENTTEYRPHRSDWSSGDPTWDDSWGKELIGALNYLASEGMNSISFIPMNVAGDGDNTWPWTAPDQRSTYDVSKLAQWNVVFSHATRNGFFLHFKTQETENDTLLSGGALGPERKLYYRELVARFGHHPALNWNLGEENTNTPGQRRAFARYVKAIDPYDHPVVIHTYPDDKEQVYSDLLGFDPFDGPSIQLGTMSDTEAWRAGRKWLQRSGQSGDPWVCSVDEPGNATNGVYPGDGGPDGGNLPSAREVMYASYLAGCYGTEWYFGYSKPHNDLNLSDFRSRSVWWEQVDVALRVIRDYHRQVRPASITSREIEDGYAMEGKGHGGAARAITYLKDGTSRFGTSYERVVYVNPRTGERIRSRAVGDDGLEAPFSGDAVGLLSN